MSIVIMNLVLASVVPAPARTLAPITGDACALGFDFGTSGVRCAVVDSSGTIVASPESYPWGEREREQTAEMWQDALFAQLEALPLEARKRVQRIAVSGTSGSMLMVGADGAPTSSRGAPRMYDFSVKKQAAGASGEQALALLAEHVPALHAVRDASTLFPHVLIMSNWMSGGGRF